jgi:hypothetical protein
MFRPHMGHHQSNFCYWGDHCTVHFVFCALRHIVVLLLVSFLENFHCILLAAISVFYVVFLFMCVFGALYLPNMFRRPISVAARSNTRTVFARSNTGIVGSNATQGIDVYVRLFCVSCVLCVYSGLATC